MRSHTHGYLCAIADSISESERGCRLADSALGSIGSLANEPEQAQRDQEAVQNIFTNATEAYKLTEKATEVFRKVSRDLNQERLTLESSGTGIAAVWLASIRVSGRQSEEGSRSQFENMSTKSGPLYSSEVYSTSLTKSLSLLSDSTPSDNTRGQELRELVEHADTFSTWWGRKRRSFEVLQDPEDGQRAMLHPRLWRDRWDALKKDLEEYRDKVQQ
jgi:hypothetical protein